MLPDPEVKETSALAAPVSSADGRVVLYVEDNVSNLKLIERLVDHRPGIRLLSAMQGRVGLDLARKNLPHLILLDLHLPDMPGEDVLRRLKQDPATTQIPVVVISADATAAQISRLLDAGARDYLTKPLDIRKFLEVLDKSLIQAPVGSPPTAADA